MSPPACRLVYASTTGNTRDVAYALVQAWGRGAIPETLDAFLEAGPTRGVLHVFCVSSWGNGLMQDDWDAAIPRLQAMDFRGCAVAICGLGDQRLYPDHFADGAGILADLVLSRGANLRGQTETGGYEFATSRAVRQGRFVGLILDVDNQYAQTEDRIKAWVRRIKKE